VTGKQLLITISYSVAASIAVVALIMVFMSTRESQRTKVDTSKLAHLESYWGYFVASFLVLLFVLTMIDLPYGNASPPKDAQRVRVVAQQFAWNIQPAVVAARRPVAFTLTSKDVQHGFGIYGPSGKLLFQVQVPAAGESAQIATFTFPKPGTYVIDCLEFCGFHHHLMTATLRVY
jgi:cytochrome c oxidase subunit 2